MLQIGDLRGQCQLNQEALSTITLCLTIAINSSYIVENNYVMFFSTNLNNYWI